VSEVPKVLTKTQEPMVLTQEEETQPQVLTQAQENSIQDESNLRGSSRANKTTHKIREHRAGLQDTHSSQKQEHQMNTQLKRHSHMHTL